jgi:hypothetical protein
MRLEHETGLVDSYMSEKYWHIHDPSPAGAKEEVLFLNTVHTSAEAITI